MMDELVKAALAKWPNVPDCYGWLALDLRGQWRLGAERQNVTNPTMNAFIGRNYGSDANGRWLFQNGPQRVYVALDYMPWIWRMVPAGASWALRTHTGVEVAAPQQAWLDQDGHFLLRAGGMAGLLHDHDAAGLLDLLVDREGTPFEADRLAGVLDAWPAPAEPVLLRWSEKLTLTLSAIESGNAAALFGFDPDPAATTPSTSH